MGKWMYAGPGPGRVYPYPPWMGLTVAPGDVRDFGDGPPDDGCWFPADPAPQAASAAPAAAQAAAKEPPAAAVPAAPAKPEGSA